MVTLISHFYNEEYLLPYWISHHRPLFDHAILIDHGSKDKSRQIISEMAPEWEVVNSTLDCFDPLLTDFEVQMLEDRCFGWKIVLNTTEFIVGPLREEIRRKDLENIKALTIQAKIMIDLKPNDFPNCNIPLIAQKPDGVYDNKIYDIIFRSSGILRIFRKMLAFFFGKSVIHSGRHRLLHAHRIGGYEPGRHRWFYDSSPSENLLIYWYGYSPWNDKFLSRKLSFSNKLPADKRGYGRQHGLTNNELYMLYKKHRAYFILEKFILLINNKFLLFLNKKE
jgi:hypothetical protein